MDIGDRTSRPIQHGKAISFLGKILQEDGLHLPNAIDVIENGESNPGRLATSVVCLRFFLEGRCFFPWSKPMRSSTHPSQRKPRLSATPSSPGWRRGDCARHPSSTDSRKCVALAYPPDVAHPASTPPIPIRFLRHVDIRMASAKQNRLSCPKHCQTLRRLRHRRRASSTAPSPTNPPHPGSGTAIAVSVTAGLALPVSTPL